MKIVRNTITYLFLLCPVLLLGQNSNNIKTEFGSDGKLIKPLVIENFTDEWQFNNQALLVEINSQRAKLESDIAGRLRSTLESLEDNPNRYTFIDSIDKKIKNYSIIINTLKLKSGNSSLDLFPNLQKTFKYLDSLKPIIDTSTIEKNKKQIIVYQPNLSNQFYAQYYNNVRCDFKNFLFNNYVEGNLNVEYKRFEKSVEQLQYLLQSDSIEPAVKVVRGLKASIIFQMFQEPWVLELLWLTKGIPTMNPFYPQLEINDLKKDQIEADSTYMAYLNNQINYKGKFDTTGNYKLYREILDERAKTKMKLSSKTALLSLDSIYNANLNKLKIGYSQLNKIQIPTTPSKSILYRYVSADNAKTNDEIEISSKMFKKGTQIKWFVHNLNVNQKIVLKELEKKTIKNTNEFEDEMSVLLGQVADVYTLVNPTTSILNNLFPTDRTTYSNGDYTIKLSELKSIDELAKSLNQQMVDTKGQKKFNNQFVLETSSLLAQKKALEDEIRKELDNTLKIAVFYKTILNSSSKLISENIPQNKSDKPILKTFVISTPETEELTSYTYQLKSIIAKDTTVIDAIKYKSGTTTRFTLSAGISYSFGSPTIQNLSTDANGKNTFKAESRSVNALVGINVYPWKLKKPTDFLPLNELPNRLFLQVGLGFPKPIDNIFTGLGVNLGPGLLVSAGAHFYSQKKYEIFNDQVTGEKRFFKTAPYVSIGIDPALFLKAIGLFGEKK